MEKAQYRLYGNPPYRIVLLHGGPGAAGSLAPLARQLHRDYSILEHLQTKGSINDELKVLKKIIEDRCQLPVILIGHSWGAWLGYLFAANFPNMIDKLILISSGPFRESYTKALSNTRRNRLSAKESTRLNNLIDLLDNNLNENKNHIFYQLGMIMERVDNYSLLPFQNKWLDCDYSLYERIWKEASDLRRKDKLVNYGKDIVCPVFAIHGDYDPHPYVGVQKPLSEVVKDFRSVLIRKCGHKPWLEKYARDKFIGILKGEIEK